ncbi:MAG: OmpA family protein [Pseudomonadales bacterium]|nr:OmpA family protein [Pseudomonadales bacterium]
MIGRLCWIVTLLLLCGCGTLKQEPREPEPEPVEEPAEADQEPQFEFTLLEPFDIDAQVQAWLSAQSGRESLQVSRAEAGYYLDVQEAQLQQALQGHGVSLARDGDSFLLRVTGAFETNSSGPSVVLRGALDAIARVVQEFRKTLVIVHSHTDATGALGYNRWLSEQRAIAVAQHLVEQGVDADRIAAVGHGESDPIQDSGTPESRVVNRRLEIRLPVIVRE